MEEGGIAEKGFARMNSSVYCFRINERGVVLVERRTYPSSPTSSAEPSPLPCVLLPSPPLTLLPLRQPKAAASLHRRAEGPDGESHPVSSRADTEIELVYGPALAMPVHGGADELVARIVEAAPRGRPTWRHSVGGPALLFFGGSGGPALLDGDDDCSLEKTKPNRYDLRVACQAIGITR